MDDRRNEVPETKSLLAVESSMIVRNRVGHVLKDRSCALRQLNWNGWRVLRMLIVLLNLQTLLTEETTRLRLAEA